MKLRSILIAGLLLLAGCAGNQGLTPDQGVNVFEPAPLVWASCSGNYQCSTIQVPLDYAQPGGQLISLALMRRPADSPSQRMGSIVIEPGGPGTSGANPIFIGNEFQNAVNADILQRFDLVGFAPRGVGATAPACGNDFAYFIAGDLMNPAASAALDGSALAYAQECANDPMVRNMGTLNVARDVEILRRALGEGNLNYFGVSYGSEVGIAYADKFPQNIRAMIIDGIYNPGLGAEGILTSRIAGVTTGLQRFFTWCDTTPAQCPLYPDSQNKYEQLLERARTSPATVPFGNRPFPLSTGWISLMNLSLVNLPEGYPILAGEIASALAGDWSTYVNGAAAAANGGVSAGVWVMCQDQPAPQGAAFDALVQNAAAAGPLIGPFLVNMQRPCKFRSFPTEPVPADYTYGSRGTAAIMVWGTTGDPATPYQSAVLAAQQLQNAVLFTLTADRHTAFGANPCVKDRQSSYLLNAIIPPGNTC